VVLGFRTCYYNFEFQFIVIFYLSIDDKTRYVWVYYLQHKDHGVEKFCEWQAMVERFTGPKLKALCTENGGEFTSTEFEGHLKVEGIKHELTVPKNSVAERINRTLVETVRGVLC